MTIIWKTPGYLISSDIQVRPSRLTGRLYCDWIAETDETNGFKHFGCFLYALLYSGKHEQMRTIYRAYVQYYLHTPCLRPWETVRNWLEVGATEVAQQVTVPIHSCCFPTVPCPFHECLMNSSCTGTFPGADSTHQYYFARLFTKDRI